MDLTEATHFDYKLSERHPWETARLNVIYKLLEAYSPSIDDSHLNILDLGCGDTFIAENLSGRFINSKIYAIDNAFNEKYINELNIKYRAKSIIISNSTDIINEEIHIILLLDVIEHIEDDVAFLKDLLSKPFITENTKIFITVPAYNSLFTSHDIFLKHYRRYNNKTLIHNLNDAGLNVAASGYFFSFLLLPRILQKLKEKILKPDVKQEEGIGNWNKGNLLSSLIKNILLTDFLITDLFNKIGLKIPGLSNFAVCKKSV